MNKVTKKINIHFIGIGGIGMSGIAEIMYDLGYLIQGSDISTSENVNRLKKKGIKIFQKHNSKNIKNVDAVVFSSAIKKNNIEIVESKKRKIPLISRADMLAELMKNKKSIAIAGSHGKTTTTSMIGNILDFSKFDPTIINGGIINTYSKNNKLGKGPWMVAEADESDASFLKLPHQISIITNIDIEHLDFYKTKKNLLKSFENFILNLPFYGVSIVCYDDKNLKQIIKKIKTRNIITYSIKSKKSDVYIDRVRNDKFFTFFRINFNKKILNYKGSYNFKISALGNHNILNGSASILASIFAGVKIKSIKKSLENYNGVKRRFTLIGEKKNYKVYDDYAHHPTEIKATLDTANIISKDVHVVFQPHRYSRTKLLINDFVKILSKVKNLYLVKTYPAGEKIIKGFESKDLFKRLQKYNKKIIYLESELNLEKVIIKSRKKNSIIIFMGAGSISKIANKYINK
tara:strand:- start:16 stop:1398 length:1383 start_codon:yes stop_codon:yes gene_type:complete